MSVEKIESLFKSFSEEKIISIDKLPQSGSDRKYLGFFVSKEIILLQIILM